MMGAARWILARFGSWSAAALSLGWLLLAAWGIGLALAMFQLGAWRQELSRTLLQLNADAHFRARIPSRDAVDPEWYRRKALALLSATERLQHDTLWTLFVPGSWQAFDALEEQVQARFEREFADIVVETVRRELYARAARLTGIPLVRGSGELQSGADCQSPVPQSFDRRLSAAAEDLPEFVAVADYVQAVERLDEAVQAFLSLQYAGGGPDQLRKLVDYAFGQQLPGALAGAVRMFQAGEEVKLQPALMQAKLQWATRCALAKGVSALHTRLLNTNDLFALEQGLVERSQGLFDAASRALPFDRALERYRAVHALLDDQQSLLARGRNDWMRQGTLQLGPAWQDLTRRIARTRLLGPEVVLQLDNQSGAAFAEFRRQFELTFGSAGEPGIVWLEDQQRFGLSPQRAALREGLAGLLKASFMAEETGPAGPKAVRDSGPLAKATQEAKALAEERERVLAQVIPTFAPQAQPVVQRLVDARVADLIYQRAYRSLKASLPTEAGTALDPVAFRRQREQVAALQAVLKEVGAPALGDRLNAVLDGELLRRLANLQEAWSRQPLQSAKLADFGWWQGEPLQLGTALGAGETAGASLQAAVTRLEPLVQQAGGLLALGSNSLAHDPAAARWVHLQAELGRYKAQAPDSSLLRLERYAAALGADLRRENCAERLAAHAPVAAHEDDIAQRHVVLHQALARRCQELRAQPAATPATLAQ